MLAKMSFAGGVLLMAAALVPTVASATPAPQSKLPGLFTADGSLVQKAQWGRCRAWRHECAARWGWRSPMFFRCLGRHGC